MVDYTAKNFTTNVAKSKLKLSTLIPDYIQTPINKNFISSTYETMFSKDSSEFITGYIGEKPNRTYNPNTDFYIEEKTKQRQDYQLVPSVVSNGNEYIARYSDIINQLGYQGSNTDSHERLLRQSYYSFGPMIDINKFLNYSQYYWVEKGPKTIDFYYLLENIIPSLNTFIVSDLSLEDGDIVSFHDITSDEIEEGKNYLIKVVGFNTFKIYANQADFDNDVEVDFDSFFFEKTYVNPQTDFGSVIGKKTAILHGVELRNGMVIRTFNDVNTTFNYERYLIEGVGDSIQLIHFNEFIGYDTSPYDTQPYDYDETDFVSEPNNIDYITSQRGSQDRNPWSMRNRWFHISVLQEQEINNAIRATRPIIEFVRNMELYDFAITSKLSVDAVYDGGDIQSETGKASSVIDGQYTFDQMRILVINDIDDARTNMIYQVYGTGTSQTFLEVEQLSEGEGVFVTNGENYGNTHPYLKDGNIRFGRTRVDRDTPLLFKLFDFNGIELDDALTYPNSNFAGSALFSYQIDETAPIDEVLGKRVAKNEYDNIIFENHLETETYEYLRDYVDTIIEGYYFFRVEGEYRNHWHKSDMLINQAIIDEFVLAPDDNDEYPIYFDLSQTPMSDKTAQPISIAVYFNGDHMILGEDFQYVNEIDDYVYTETNRIKFSDSVWHDFTNGSHIKIYSYSDKVPELPISGYYEVPSLIGFVSNPTNEGIDYVSMNEVFEHFSTMLTRQDDFLGQSIGMNNSNDLKLNFGRGNKIIQNDAGIVRTASLNADPKTDIMESLRYCEREYVRFYNKLGMTLDSLFKEGYDGSIAYATWIEEAITRINIGKNETMPFYNSLVADYEYVPPSPQYLGILPMVVPQIYYDTTMITPRFMMRNHDGSVETPRSGSFTVFEQLTIDADPNNNILTQSVNYPWEFILMQGDNTLIPDVDYKMVGSQRVDFMTHTGVVDVIYIPHIIDRAKLYFESQIYTSSIFKDSKSPYQLMSKIPSYMNESDYSIAEFHDIIKPHFNRWVSFNGYDSYTNGTFDLAEKKTWNYSGTVTKDGYELSGTWRSIFKEFYGTYTPQRTPWEMLGIYIKPDWWESEYGPHPYTENNTKLWEDIQNGIVRHGVNTKGRPYIMDYIPVDGSGQLKTIEQIFGSQEPNIIARKAPWTWGDISPAEFEWMSSHNYPFALLMALYSMYPNTIVEQFWEVDNNYTQFPEQFYSQFVDSTTGKRYRYDEAKIHNTLDGNERVFHYGIQQYIVAFLAQSGLGAEYLQEKISTTGVNMSYGFGGFSDKSNTRFFADNFGLMPNESVHNVVHKSAPTKDVAYSGIIVTKEEEGYRFNGFDGELRQFDCMIPDTNSTYYTINVGGEQAPIYEWQSDIRYNTGTYIRHHQNIFRCVIEHRSGGAFDDSNWAKVSSVPLIGGITVKIYDRTNGTTHYPYDFVTNDPQVIMNMFNGYQRYLENDGFVFDITDPLINDFTGAAKELFKWMLDKPEVGDTRAFSPFADKFVYNSTFGFIDDLTDRIAGQSSLMNNNGMAFNVADIILHRDSNYIEGTVDKSTTSDTINRIRLKVTETEHVSVFDNETKFGDIIIDHKTGIYQNRFKIHTLRSSDWDGSYRADGFIIDNETIIPNSDKNADDFANYYDIEKVITDNLFSPAKKLVGFQKRGYYDNLQFDQKEAFQFYLGMIHDKGTEGSINKILRNEFVKMTNDVELNEEWAIKLGSYGAVESYDNLVIKVQPTDFKSDSQIIAFLDSGIDDPRDNEIEIPYDDDRFIIKDQRDTEKFSVEHATPIYPYAGYPLLTEANQYAMDISSTIIPVEGDYVWFAEYENDWNVFRIVTLPNNVISSDATKLIMDDVTDLEIGQVIYVNGINNILKIEDIQGNEITIGEYDGTIEEGPLFTHETVRFADMAAFNTETRPDGHYFIDSIDGKYAVVDQDGVIIREEQPKVSYKNIVSAHIMDGLINAMEMNLYHPNMGIFPYEIGENVDFKTPYDPTNYDDCTTEVGMVWWDTSKVKFLDYDQGDLLYKMNHWGKQFPGSSIDVYQWIRSPVPPSRWSEYMDSTEGAERFSPETVANDKFVTVSEYNILRGNYQDYYYFWVKDNKLKLKKTQSIKDLAGFITNPRVSGLKWLSPIASNAFLLSNVRDIINDDTYLNMVFKEFDTDNIIHSEWTLVGSKTSERTVPQFIFDKVKESMIGFREVTGTIDEMHSNGITDEILTEYGYADDLVRLPVPDPNIVSMSKYGSMTRPRQSWYRDIISAKYAFVNSVNRIMQKHTWADSSNSWQNYLHQEDAAPSADEVVDSLYERDSLIGTMNISIGHTVLVEHDITINGKWSLWEYNGDSFDQISRQGFRGTDYWYLTDYIKDGYDLSRIFITKTYDDIASRNNDLNNLITGDIVKVTDNGTGLYSIFEVTSRNNQKYFEIISKEKATIAFDTLICRCPYGKDAIGFLFDAFMNSLSSVQDKNEFLVDMMKEVFRQHHFVDWIMKTSYVNVVGIEEDLLERSVFTNDLSSYVTDYINEVKPYHVKLRGQLDKRKTPIDDLNILWDDFHELDITINFNRVDMDDYEYQGTVLDGKTFRFFDNLMSAGYDVSSYDGTILGYDYNAQDIQTLYDAVINGKTFTDMFDEVKDTIVDGGQFYQPLLSEKRPPEMAYFAMGDTLSLDVYSIPWNINLEYGYDVQAYDFEKDINNELTGYDYSGSEAFDFIQRPKVVQDLYLTNNDNKYPLTQIPQSNDAVMVYLENILVDQNQYEIVWDHFKPYVKLSFPSYQKKLKIVSYSVGGYSNVIFEKLYLDIDTNIFDVGTTIMNGYEVVAIVDGEPSPVNTLLSGNSALNDQQVEVDYALAGATVYLVVYEGDRISKTNSQNYQYMGFPQTIHNPSGPSGFEEANTIVYKGGRRLIPSYIKYFKFDEDIAYIKSEETLYNKDQIKIFIDGVELDPMFYNLSKAEQKIYFTFFISEGSEIALVNGVSAEYHIEDDDLYIHGIAIGRVIPETHSHNVITGETLTINGNTISFLDYHEGNVDIDYGEINDVVEMDQGIVGTEDIYYINNKNVNILATDTLEDIVEKINEAREVTKVFARIDGSHVYFNPINGHSMNIDHRLDVNNSTGVNTVVLNLVDFIQENLGSNYRVSTVDGRLKIVYLYGNIYMTASEQAVLDALGFGNSYTVPYDKVRVITTSNNEYESLRTEVMRGNLAGDYAIYQTPSNNNSTNVTVIDGAPQFEMNTQSLSIYGKSQKYLSDVATLMISELQAKDLVEYNDMVQQSNFVWNESDIGYGFYYDQNYDAEYHSAISFNVPHLQHNTVIVSTYSGTERSSKYSYKILKTLTNQMEYYTISDENKTTISQKVYQTDDEIFVNDPDRLATPQPETNTPAYIWVDGEVIGYYEIVRSGSNGVLRNLVRGAKGTAFGYYNTVDKAIDEGTEIVNLTDTRLKKLPNFPL